MFRLLIISCIGLFAIFAVSSISSTSYATGGVLDSQGEDLMETKPKNHPTATFAGGCFWCLESEFRALDGVLFTRVGYVGGMTSNPDYQSITTGTTGHAEVVEVTYDPKKITFNDLLQHYLTKAHDPTQLNRQGVDKGTQYRSEVFYHDEEQRQIAEALIKEIDAKKIYTSKIVTLVSPITTFWEGEEYHQQYYEKWEKTKGEVHPRVFFKKQMKGLKGE